MVDRHHNDSVGSPSEAVQSRFGPVLGCRADEAAEVAGSVKCFLMYIMRFAGLKKEWEERQEGSGVGRERLELVMVTCSAPVLTKVREKLLDWG